MNVKKDDTIILADPEGKPLKNEFGEEWIVLDIDGNKIIAAPPNTKDRHIFHKSRVLFHNGKQTDALSVAKKQSLLTNKLKPNMSTKSPIKKTIKRPSDKKGQPIPLDLKELTYDGGELYSKNITGFDHPDIVVISHCLVSADKKTYKCFQTYNGSLGRKSGKSIPKKRYDIRERDGGYAQFVKDLMDKKNYNLIKAQYE